MTGAPIGSVVKLYFDTLRNLEDCDVVQSPSGRAYRIVNLRRQTKGIHEGRWHVEGLVIDPKTITTDDVVYEYVWYPRRKRQR